MCLIKEAARLMGFRGTSPEGQTLEALTRAVKLVQALPVHTATRSCLFAWRDDCLFIDGTAAPGKNLARHLAGCREGLFIGATLGVAGDTLLRRESLLGLTQAAATQAALSARLEEGLDKLCRDIEEQKEGFSLTPRFSPGYGDLPLTFQPFFMEKLQMHRLGVCLTPSFIMTPAKSVTAVAGWKKGPCAHPDRKCALCPNTSCAYRAQEEPT